jgi:hypothetical protein
VRFSGCYLLGHALRKALAMIAILGFSFPIIGHSKNVQSQNPKTKLFVSSYIPWHDICPSGMVKERKG